MWMYSADGDAYWVDVDEDFEMRNAPPLQSRVSAMRRSQTQRARPARLTLARPIGGMAPMAPTAPVFVAPPDKGTAASINLRNLSVGTLAQLAAKVLAAITPLPEPPPSPPASASAQDIALDQLEYQRRLAGHAKSNERIRTLGDVVSAVVD